MATQTATLERQSARSLNRKTVAWVLVGAAVILLVLHQLLFHFDAFPDAWNLHLRDPLDQFQRWVVANRRDHWLFVYCFGPLSSVIDFVIRRTEDFLLWLPWPVLVTAVFLLAQKIADLRIAILTTGCLLLMGLMGLWEESMVTLALMVIAVIISLLIGIPLGIWTARNDKVEGVLRPILDAMQTMPAFVYLIPVVLFFGVARVPSAIATIVYAIPPAVRLTNLGIRQVPDEAVEAARAFGTTDRQLLYKVQIPMALPTIMAGVNQTIMMALSIVVIAALIGSGGLGDVVLKSLRRLRVGQALEAGLAIVFMAILLDRISYAFSQIEHTSHEADHEYRLLPEQWGYKWAQAIERELARLYGWSSRLTRQIGRVLARPLPAEKRPLLTRRSDWVVGLLLLVVLTAVTRGLGDSAEALVVFPESWNIGLREPIDALVKWAQVNLYEIGAIGNIAIGTGPFSDFVTLYLLRPLVTFLQAWLVWPVLVLLVAAAAYAVSGRRLALGTVIGLLAVGLLGMWEESMQTLGQVIIAVLLSIVLGVPLGILSARSNTAERLLRPILDFLQTIPPFVYLVPVIMLFNVGSVPGIIASVLYAIPPVIRLTNLGIRQVDQAAVEACDSFGSTSMQRLAKVELPLALPAIMAGINQTIMMVLAMVIIAGLIGGAGLGFEVVAGLAQNEMGRGVEAGLAIVILAIILDRMTQAWAQRRAEAANLAT